MTGHRRRDGVTRPAPITILCDGVPVQAHPGETLAAVLLAQGQRRVRDDRSGQPRGLFCNMGTCSECFVWVQTGENTSWRRRRACLTPVVPDLRLRRQEATDED